MTDRRSMKLYAVLMLAALIAMPSVALAEGGTLEPVQSAEHWVSSGDAKLYVWEKFTGSPEHKRIVLLAHGSATAGKESFDLQVAGKPDISVMDRLAREGFDVFALDVRGFGRSTHPAKHFRTADASSDLNAVADHVLKLRGAAKLSLLGWSYGTQYAGMFVMAHPEKVDRYISYAQMGSESADIARRKQSIDTYQNNVYIKISEAAWHNRFMSLTPAEVNFPEVVDAYAKAAASIEIETPTSPQLDLVTLLPMLNAKLMTVPVMLIHGQYDDVADTHQLLPFFDMLPNPNKRYVIVPDAGHMMMFQKGYHLFQDTVVAYLKQVF